MTFTTPRNLRRFAFNIGLMFIIYSICRALFVVFNLKYFQPLSVSELSFAFLHGLRFDASAIALLSSLYIILELLPIKGNSKGFKITKTIALVLPNTLGILSNCGDMIYFRFIYRRSGADVFDMIGSRDFAQLLPQFIKDFWFIPLLWLLFTTAHVIFVLKQDKTNTGDDSKPSLIKGLSILLLAIGLSLLAFRGGFQLRPLSIINACDNIDPKYSPIVLNSPFSIIKTAGKQKLDDKQYMPLAEAQKLISPIHYPKENAKFNNMNVVIIIMESFSSEYIGYFNKINGKSFTPYLDSLISQSFVFTQAYANGKKSIEGIPAILSGTPSLMNTPYITSFYSGNKIDGLGSILKEKGYTTAFFHGGSNGTMGFDSYVKSAGFDKYYGRNEYNNDNDFDGKWGIFDEPFFQYFSKSLDKMQQPFACSFFSLSSHHPYTVPDKYKQKFTEGPLPILKSISYADFALKRFFETAQTAEWFNNTIFVITSDHTSDAITPAYKSRTGMYKIPIIVYSPKLNLKGSSNNTTQQIDIIPTVLNLLNYDKPYFSFGRDAMDSSKHGFAINYINDTYMLMQNDSALIFDGSKASALYNYSSDPENTKNILTESNSRDIYITKFAKAFIQQYNFCMINNKMRTEK